jgi:hypothetical protein
MQYTKQTTRLFNYSAKPFFIQQTITLQQKKSRSGTFLKLLHFFFYFKKIAELHFAAPSFANQ